MAGEIAAKRHAQAVFQIASERGEQEKWRSDLNLMAAAFSDPDLISILEDPKVQFDQKASLIKRCLPGASPLALNLAYLLISRRRVRILGQIASEYERLVDAQQGLEHAEVTTATPIDNDTEKSIAEHLAEVTGNRIVISSRVDPEIIGGFVARVGDRLIDGSVRNKLEALRESLTQKAR